jgi:hypothetical protein
MIPSNCENTSEPQIQMGKLFPIPSKQNLGNFIHPKKRGAVVSKHG